jgi:type II secretory pathway pseudopilin PulG
MRERAFTLLELLVLVLVLAIVGGGLIRRSASADAEQKVELAAFEVASALRFAQSEAMRTGLHHGARFGSADDRIRVYRLDTSGSPPTELYSIYHPVDKKPYDLKLDTGSFTSGVKIADSHFRFKSDSGDRESVAFDPRGAPVSPGNLLELQVNQAWVDVAYKTSRRVLVAPVTGRVTVQ